MSEAEALAVVHEAIGGLVPDGEIVVAWTLQLDVAGPEDTRYLAHRAGGGIDGTDKPLVWQALGMIASALAVAEDQLRDNTADTEDEDE